MFIIVETICDFKLTLEDTLALLNSLLIIFQYLIMGRPMIFPRLYSPLTERYSNLIPTDSVRYSSIRVAQDVGIVILNELLIVLILSQPLLLNDRLPSGEVVRRVREERKVLRVECHDSFQST